MMEVLKIAHGSVPPQAKDALRRHSDLVLE